MKTLLLFLCGLTAMAAMQAQIIHVPGDFPTIQQAIDTAQTGDTVLVSPGTYLENIIFTKNITVGSMFLTTQDTSYISQTIIDGNQAGSVVQICFVDTTAVLTGFTLTNGNSSRGGGVCVARYVYFPIWGWSWVGGSPSLQYLKIIDNSAENGGGVFAIGYCRPKLYNVTVSGNNAKTGGGLCCFISYGSMGSLHIPAFDMMNVTIVGNCASQDGGGLYLNTITDMIINGFRAVNIFHNSAMRKGGGVYFRDGQSMFFDSILRSNIYSNIAPEGNDLYNVSDHVCKVVADTFSVLYPKEFHATPLSKFTFDISHGYHEQVNADLYVSPWGNNANSGLIPDQPLRNINGAFSIILADSQNPRTVRLLEGNYSRTVNGEVFPINVPEYVGLKGISANSVILDAEDTATVIQIKNRKPNHLSGMTIKGGAGEEGGGIYCENSILALDNLIITNNLAGLGGGIYSYFSSLALQNVILTENTAGSEGGGIYQYNTTSLLQNVTLSCNSATLQGSGIYGKYVSMSTLVNTIMWNNANEEINLSGIGTTVTIENSDIDGGQEGIVTTAGSMVNWLEGNLYQDPLFTGNGEYPYALAKGSICIDAGKFDTTGMNMPATDILGNPRIWDSHGYGLSIIDMGAYEFGGATVSSILPDQVACKNDSIAFEIVANGFPPMAYQWQKNSENIPGATDPLLVIQHVQVADTGFYRCIVMNGYSADTGNSARLTVYLPHYSEILGKSEVKAKDTVQYCVQYHSGHHFNLTVNGGTRIAGTDTTIMILWDSPGTGYVHLVETEEHGCKADTVSIKVSIQELGIVQHANCELQITNWPNPFTTSTIFQYYLNEPSNVVFRIFNNFGQMVAEPVNTRQQKGVQTFQWNMDDQSGLYYYRIQAGSRVGSGKIIKL